MNTDRDLYERFARLRAHESRRAPGFEQMRVRQAPRTRRVNPALAWSSATVAAALLVWVLGVKLLTVPGAGPAPTAAVTLDPWSLPTDVLLDTPGREFLRTVPRFGDTEPGAPRSDEAPGYSLSFDRRTLT